ncbi:MAG: hypothetical protein IJ666_03425 [Ruminococcus sp.]|nr:hypothetical protein [Ruminococcus sp.]
MQVFSNLWGGEGYLTAASLITMASVGMFSDIKDNGGNLMDIRFRCLDFATESPDDKRWKNMKEAYNKYFKIIFGDEAKNCLVNENIQMNSFLNQKKPKLNQKYANPEFLALGFSEKEMGLDIKRGIYGKPWIGEAYYADTNFAPLYNSATDSIVVINAGGYKGGGTAATFIYLENRHRVKENNHKVKECSRYDVIVGPSTQFNKYTKLPHPEIYGDASLNGDIDIFDSGEILERLRNTEPVSSDSGNHSENIKFLEKIWDNIDKNNYADLNPKNYMPRFIDRVSSDATLNDVVPFINMKYPLVPDGDSYDYDVTSDAFAADGQSHRLHITNLLSAVTIQEIAMNHDKGDYAAGTIYSFNIPDVEKYTVDGVFNADDAAKVYRFIAFSAIMIKYLYNCFYDITTPGADTMLKKWALSKKPLIGDAKVILDNRKEHGRRNFAFANTVTEYLANFVHEYIKPVLIAFKDVDDTSEDVEFFSKKQLAGSPFSNGLYGIVSDLIDSVTVDQNTRINISVINNARAINDTIQNILAEVMTRNGKLEQFSQSLSTIKSEQGGDDFLKVFQIGMPEFGSMDKERTWNADVNDNNLKEYAENYCQQLIRYTYDHLKNNFI